MAKLTLWPYSLIRHNSGNNVAISTVFLFRHINKGAYEAYRDQIMSKTFNMDTF